MRGGAPIAAVAVAFATLAGCGKNDASTPAACFGGTATYLTALEAAPGEVRLEGATPISDCLVDGQEGGALSQIAQLTVAAAADLNKKAKADPAGDATVRLGYLVGAVQEGAADTGGIHADLVRRLDAAARFSEGGKPFPAEFERAFGEGYAAGQAGG